MAAATCTAFASAVLGVAPYVVANKFKNILEVKNYGKDKAISCCVLENAVNPSQVGCIRRCTLNIPGYEEKLLREQLTAVTETGTGNGVISDVHGVVSDRGVNAEFAEVKGNHRTVVELTCIPCGPSEAHRSIFPADVDAAIVSTRTVMTVSEVSSSVNRCYVELETTATFTHPASTIGLDDEARLARLSTERTVHSFWQQFLDSLLYSLEATILSEYYPIMNNSIDVEFRQAYEVAEEAFCQWAAANGDTLPRQAVLDRMEAALLSWSRVLREYRHAKLAAETAQGDVAGTRRIAAETARQLAERTAAVQDLQQQLSDIQDTDARHKEFVAMSDTVTSMRETMDNQRRARQLLVERHKREYGSQPGVSAKVGTNDADSIFAPARNPPPPTRVDAAGGEADANAAAGTTTATPATFKKSMLGNLFAPDGALNENQATEVFHALLRLPTESSGTASAAAGEARRGGDYVTAEGMRTVLMSMDHVGLYEDVDGTQEQLAEWRCGVQRSFASRYNGGTTSRQGVAADGKSVTEAGNVAAMTSEQERTTGVDASKRAAPTSTSDGVTNALSKMVARHDAHKEELRLAAMGKLAEDTVARYAFREGGKLYFDEFCLALMHLFK